MNAHKMIRIGLAVLTLLILTTGAALAWPDQPPDRATLSGPGLTGEIEITGKENLEALKLGALEDFTYGPIAAPNVGEGYRITRYFYEASFNFGVLHYYPDPSGGRGYVFFEDGPDLSGNHTAYNGQWFYATPEGDAAMQRILAQVAAPASSPTGLAAPARALAPTLALLGALAAVLLDRLGCAAAGRPPPPRRIIRRLNFQNEDTGCFDNIRCLSPHPLCGA